MKNAEGHTVITEGWASLERSNREGINENLEWRSAVSRDGDLRPGLGHIERLCGRSETSEGELRREREHDEEGWVNYKSVGIFESFRGSYAQC